MTENEKNALDEALLIEWGYGSKIDDMESMGIPRNQAVTMLMYYATGLWDGINGIGLYRN